MAFFRKVKLNGKWYLRAVTSKRPATTDDVAKRLSLMSTVSPGDTYVVLMGLGPILAQMMAEGKSVHLKGVGTFYYSCQSKKQGVDTPEEVSPQLISDIKVRFIPEYSRGQRGQVTERTLIDPNIEWVEIGKI